jgi:ABC-type nitrate/sulfonate/bicarbonate transport system permease component
MMFAQSREQWTSRCLGVFSIATILTIWEISGRTGALDPVLLPRPSLILLTFLDIVFSGRFASPLAHTLALFAVGYGIACVLGVSLGIAMGTSPTLYGVFEPLVEILRPIPKPALVPALFLFLGIGNLTMVTVVVLAVLFPVVINTLQGVRSLDPVLLDTARTFQLSRRRTIQSVILPATTPLIFAGMRVGLGLGLVLVVLAEMLAGETGIGFLILDLQRSFQIKEMFAWLLILVLLGGGLTFLFNKIEAYLVPWRGRA